MTMTEADIAEIADSWTQEDLAEWGIPWPGLAIPPSQW